MSTWVGIDVGGTFTDVVVYANNGARMVTAKVPSTPDDPSVAFVNGLETGLKKAGSEPRDVSRIVHGSTVGINAFLQRKGAKVGIICTRGFEDTLAIGRAKRKQMYDFRLDYQTPVFLADRENTVGVSTRLDPNGSLIDEATAEEIDSAIDYLVLEKRVESIALNLLFSYTDPSVEQRIAQRINERHPHVFVSSSAAIDPRVREYERLVVTALDAYIRPLISQYVKTLRRKLAELGVQQTLYMMESHGGVLDAGLLDQAAVSVLMSGLAGGAIGASKIGTLLHEPDLLSVDMGGTSTDVTLITGGSAVLSDESVVGTYDVRLPMVDVHTVGAGGGSLAEIDIAGGLRVGPESAGAEPGPACYGRGNTRPTVTDANVVLGYLPNARLADGSMQLDPALAEKAITDHIARPTGKTTEEAAWAVHRVAVASMANAARVVSIKRGIDVRDYALFPCGGAGPMHACGIADELNITRVVIPPFPGVLSAYGLLAADAVTNIWQTRHAALDSPTLEALREEIESSVRAAEQQTQAKAPDTSDFSTVTTLSMRYAGQSHELDVTVLPADLTADDAPSTLRAAFDALHLQRYGQKDDVSACEITGYKVSSTGYRSAPKPRFQTSGSNDQEGERFTRFYDPARGDFVDALVIRRDALSGAVRGPAIVEQADTTIVVQSGWEATTGEGGALILARTDDPGWVDQTSQLEGVA